MNEYATATVNRSSRTALFCGLAALAILSVVVGASPRAEHLGVVDVPLTLAQRLERDSRQAAHPLDPAIVWASEALERATAIPSYSCELVKLEEVDGSLVGPHHLFVKIRNAPFSIYLRYLAPHVMSGREGIYVHGQNENKVIGHLTGFKHRMFGAEKLDPRGSIAMRGNRYPVTDTGLVRMLERTIEVALEDRRHVDVQVRFLHDVQIAGRSCSGLELVHPKQRPELRYHIARVFVDEALQLPVRFEAYRWPDSPDGEPRLVEDYTYSDIRFDEQFADEDFSIENQAYAFGRKGATKIAKD